jgi:hypothetical protein
MSFNGSGTFVINSAGQPVVANTVISATVFNALTSDLATGLSTCITKDGQTTVTANIPFGSNKITGLGAGTVATDAANLGQVQSTAAKLISVTGTDTITGTMSPVLTAYAAGQLFYFISNGTNTGAMTINIDGLGAKAITRDGSTALIAGDVVSGEIVVICYDGTRFQMINAANSFGNTTINGTLTVTGDTALQANVSVTSALTVNGTFGVTGAATLGSTLSVAGKSDLPTVSTASMNAAVAVVTTGTVTNLTSTSASIASMNAGVALLTTATVTTLTASGASIASANIGNLQFTAASIASINAGVAVINNLTATSASIASANVGTAVITTGTLTSLTATSASIASMNAGVALLTTATVTNLTATEASIASANAGNLQVTGASVASANVGVALITTGTITSLTATGASVASANVGTAVVTGLTVTNASIASLNAGTATITTGNLNFSGTAQRITGDFSNATAANQVLVQTSTTNGSTTFGIITNGTGTNSTVRLFQSSDPANSSVASININPSDFRINSTITGTGTYLPMAFITGGSERVRIDTSGNVGIGTSSPGSKLVVGNQSAIYGGGTTNENVAIVAGVPPSADTARGMFGIYDQTSAAAGVGGSVTFGGSFNGTSQTFFAGIKGVKTNGTPGDATGDLLLAPRSGNTIFYGAMYSSERMRIDTSGNVGIGTSSPATKLAVNGGVQILAGNALNFQNAAADANGTISNSGASGNSTLSFNSGALLLNGSGNLGLGVTPSAWSGYGVPVFEMPGSGTIVTQNQVATFGANWYYSGSNFIYKTSAAATYYNQNAGAHRWFNAPSGTAGNAITFTQAMTLDASGDLGVGSTSPNIGNWAKAITLDGGTNGNSSFEIGENGSLKFVAAYDTVENYGILGMVSNEPVIFRTNNTERARITSGGYFKASNAGTYVSSTGAYHELRQTQDDITVIISATNASQTANVVEIYAARNTTNNTFYPLNYYNTGASAYKFRVADSGNVTNTNGSYGTISDAKMKTDIVDAGSQWADIKALRFRKFKMKDDPSGLTQLGVVAQEVEQTSPGLVDEHADFEEVEVTDDEGNVKKERQPTGTTTKSVKTSILLMKAAVALQEAMARIEQLETKVAALESK